MSNGQGYVSFIMNPWIIDEIALELDLILGTHWHLTRIPNRSDRCLDDESERFISQYVFNPGRRKTLLMRIKPITKAFIMRF